MKIDVADSELCLSEDKPLRVTGAAGLRVCCTLGTIWITTSGDPEDTFLRVGQSHRIVNGKLTLIESIGLARIRVELPAQAKMPSVRMRWRIGGLASAFCYVAALLSRTGRAASGQDSRA